MKNRSIRYPDKVMENKELFYLSASNAGYIIEPSLCIFNYLTFKVGWPPHREP